MGTEIVNRQNGERIVITRSGEETDGEVLEFDFYLAPGGSVPDAHFHAERFARGGIGQAGAQAAPFADDLELAWQPGLGGALGAR